ncbi:hypothetical protein LCM4573_21395 [Rhizobium sp. LCM 4573]|nr:hypothetical protein LCM4573_21395 [Rhizobium sp. LCM 4573]
MAFSLFRCTCVGVDQSFATSFNGRLLLPKRSSVAPFQSLAEGVGLADASHIRIASFRVTPS